MARRYARALFGLALERDLLNKIQQELAVLTEILDTNGDLRQFLYAPQVDRSDKRAALEELFQDRFSNVFFNFLMLLVEKGRQNLMAQIRREFEALYDRHRNLVRAEVFSAVPLADEQIEELRRALASRLNSEVEVDNRLDPSVIAGVVVKIDGQVLDGSIRHQLKRLGENLLDQRN